DPEAGGPRALPPRPEPDDHRRRPDPAGGGRGARVHGDPDRARDLRPRQRPLDAAGGGTRPRAPLRRRVPRVQARGTALDPAPDSLEPYRLIAAMPSGA